MARQTPLLLPPTLEEIKRAARVPDPEVKGGSVVLSLILMFLALLCYTFRK